MGGCLTMHRKAVPSPPPEAASPPRRPANEKVAGCGQQMNKLRANARSDFLMAPGSFNSAPER